MKKGFYLLLGLMAGLFAFASCDETKETDPYANWKVRNERFLDSIADVAHTNESGKWKVIRSFSQIESTPGEGSIPTQGEVSDYIYAEVLQSAEGEDCRQVLYTDTVEVHYRGKLINGVSFDESYSQSELDYELLQPTSMAVSNLINGFTTALLNMREGDHSLPQWQYKGDRWKVYIPYQLGYGTSKYGESIPAYSVLIFDIALVRTWGPGEDVPDWN